MSNMQGCHFTWKPRIRKFRLKNLKIETFYKKPRKTWNFEQKPDIFNIFFLLCSKKFLFDTKNLSFI